MNTFVDLHSLLNLEFEYRIHKGSPIILRQINAILRIDIYFFRYFLIVSTMMTKYEIRLADYKSLLYWLPCSCKHKYWNTFLYLATYSNLMEPWGWGIHKGSPIVLRQINSILLIDICFFKIFSNTFHNDDKLYLILSVRGIINISRKSVNPSVIKELRTSNSLEYRSNHYVTQIQIPNQ